MEVFLFYFLKALAHSRLITLMMSEKNEHDDIQKMRSESIDSVENRNFSETRRIPHPLKSSIRAEEADVAIIIIPEEEHANVIETRSSTLQNIDDTAFQHQLLPIAEVIQDQSFDADGYESLSKYRRIMGLLMIIFLCSFFIPNIANEKSQIALFAIVYSSLGIFLVDSISKIFKRHTYSWQRMEEVSRTFDILVLLVFAVLLHLNLSINFQMTKFILIPSLTGAVLYKLASTAPDAVQDAEMSSKIFFTMQLFLLGLQLDGNVNWSWGIVLCFIWFYLAMVIFYFTLLIIILFMIIVFSMLGKRVYENLDRKTQFIGHFWFMLYVGFGAIAFLALIEITTMEPGKEQNPDFLINWALVARCLSLFLIAYGAIFKKKILLYLSNANNEEEIRSSERLDAGLDHAVVDVQTKETVSYFKKISSTYFTPTENKSFTISSPSEPGRQNQQEEETNCYVCFENPRNAIIMNCGHGGVCVDCALKYIKRKNQCMECRQKSNQILKIDAQSCNLENESVKCIEEINIIFE